MIEQKETIPEEAAADDLWHQLACLATRDEQVSAISQALLSERQRALEEAAWKGEAPFITSNSDAANGHYWIEVKVHSLTDLHTAHDIVLRSFGGKL